MIDRPYFMQPSWKVCKEKVGDHSASGRARIGIVVYTAKIPWLSHVCLADRTYSERRANERVQSVLTALIFLGVSRSTPWEN